MLITEFVVQRFHLDEFTSPVERANVCEVLKRIRFIGFHSEAWYIHPVCSDSIVSCNSAFHAYGSPAWFDKSIAVLLMSDAGPILCAPQFTCSE